MTRRRGQQDSCCRRRGGKKVPRSTSDGRLKVPKTERRSSLCLVADLLEEELAQEGRGGMTITEGRFALLREVPGHVEPDRTAEWIATNKVVLRLRGGEDGDSPNEDGEEDGSRNRRGRAGPKCSKGRGARSRSRSERRGEAGPVDDLVPGTSGTTSRRGYVGSEVSVVLKPLESSAAASTLTAPPERAPKRPNQSEDPPTSLRLAKRARELKERFELELDAQPTEHIVDAVGEDTGAIIRLAHSSRNLQGTAQKALYEAAARIRVATDIMRQRAAATPEEDALEDLRREMLELRNSNGVLKSDLKKAREDIGRLKAQCAAATAGSPPRTFGGKPKVRRRRDSEEEEEPDDGEGAASEDVQSLPALSRAEDLPGALPPVYRPPLRGAATRNLDDGSLGPPRGGPGGGTPALPDPAGLRDVIVAVLRDLGVVGQKLPLPPPPPSPPPPRAERAGAPLSGAAPPPGTAKTGQGKKKGGKKKKKRKGKTEPASAPPSRETAPAGRPAPSGALPASGSTGAAPPRGNKEGEWVTVVRQAAKPRAGPVRPGALPRGASGKTQGARDGAAPKKKKKGDPPKGKGGQGSSSPPKLARPPRSLAVMITAPPGSYAEVMREAKRKISAEMLGTQEIRPKRSATGAMLLELPGRDAVKADALADRLREALAGKEGVVVSRPQKKTDLRVRDLDEATTPEDIAQAVASCGGCAAEEVKVGPIRWAADGLGTAWLQCPLEAARKVTALRRMRVGWLACRVEALQPRGMQCFRCLEAGHIGARCTSTTDRSQCCYRCGREGHRANACTLPLACPSCSEKGLRADHKIGSAQCGAASGRGPRARPPAGGGRGAAGAGCPPGGPPGGTGVAGSALRGGGEPPRGA